MSKLRFFWFGLVLSMASLQTATGATGYQEVDRFEIGGANPDRRNGK